MKFPKQYKIEAPYCTVSNVHPSFRINVKPSNKKIPKYNYLALCECQLMRPEDGVYFFVTLH